MILDGICLQNAMNCSMSSFLNQQITPHDSMKNKICGSFYCNRTIQNAGNIQIAVLSAQNDIIRHNIRDFVIVIYFHFFHPLSSLNYSTGREPPTRRYIFTMNALILSTQNGEPVASSRDVAKRFGKEHKNVMQAVANLVAENSAAKSMFHPATFENRGKKYPMYLMNRDGFSLLAMGFTGKEAVQWKLKYIKAFNQMEKQLAAQHKEQQAVQDANIQSAIDRVIEARKKLDENTAFLDECRKNREDSKAKYMQVKALCGEFKAIYGQHCDTVRTMENVVRGSQSFLTNAIDSLTIVAKGYPFYAALMDSLLDGLPAEKKEE